MDFIIVRCHKLLFILFFTLFFNEWGAQAASKRPAILIDIVDDQVTMADEYALVLHSLGAINLVGFVVTEDGEGDSEKVINRLKNLTNKKEKQRLKRSESPCSRLKHNTFRRNGNRM